MNQAYILSCESLDKNSATAYKAGCSIPADTWDTKNSPSISVDCQSLDKSSPYAHAVSTECVIRTSSAIIPVQTEDGTYMTSDINEYIYLD